MMARQTGAEGALVEMEPTPEHTQQQLAALETNSRRLPDGASDHDRAWSGDGGHESGASKDGVHLCQDRCSRVPEEARCLER